MTERSMTVGELFDLLGADTWNRVNPATPATLVLILSNGMRLYETAAQNACGLPMTIIDANIKHVLDEDEEATTGELMVRTWMGDVSIATLAQLRQIEDEQ